MSAEARARRQERLGKCWTETVAELMRRRMANKDCLVGYRDESESFGERFLDECERATPWAFVWWSPPKGPGISRGKSRSLAANPTGERE